MTQEELARALQTSRVLCNADLKVSPEMRERIASQINGVSANDMDSYFCGDDLNAGGMSMPSPTRSIDNYNEESIDKSGLPDFIKESFKNQKIEMKSNPTLEGAVNLINESDKKNTKKTVTTINEAPHANTVMESQTSNGGGIDYSIIRAIVKDCLESYGGKTALNESATLNSIVLGKGGQISLVDTKGNIFTAKLQKTGNLNESKKK